MKKKFIVILMVILLVGCQLSPVISMAIGNGNNLASEKYVKTENVNKANMQIKDLPFKAITKNLSIEDELESTEYIIDSTNNIIYRVLPQTSIEVFKRKFSSTNIKVFKDKTEIEEVTSGIIATGMVLKDLDTNKIYEISVIGDLDSNGQIARTELTQVIRCVVGLTDYQFTGIYFRSSDINNDNRIDHIDITLLIRYNVYGELEIEENKEVEPPIINIVSGTLGENDWYKSNVVVKILQNSENSNIEKTTYKIFGEKEVEETVITSDETIELDQGTYTIVANSYTKSGYKSLTTKKVIKIDKIAPIPGTLNMWIDEENSTVYENNTWTNKDVVISCQDGTDRDSGHGETSYYVKDFEQIPEGTKTKETLSETGIYQAVVVTKDIAGNSSTREYTIKIDKSTLVSPEIIVIKGNKHDGSEWYYDDVELKIIVEQPNEGYSRIMKSTYKIEGDKTVDEEPIQNNENILINTNGIFTITTYNYNEAGEKSSGNSITIKRDDTAPIPGTLNMYTDEENLVMYENGTWTNKDVVLSCQDGTDNESGHSETSYYVKDFEQIPEGTKTKKTLSETGTYQAVVVTKDIAGNSSTREYTIKIDKSTLANPEFVIVQGNKHEGSEWYYNDVELKVTVQQPPVGYSRIIRTTYKIEGDKTIEERTLQYNESIVINTNGTFKITTYNYNEAGEKSSGNSITIKRDDTIPDAPDIQISGTKEENNTWYRDNVIIQVTPPEIQEPLSPIVRVTYSIEKEPQPPSSVVGAEGGVDDVTPKAEEIDITGLKRIVVQEDGIFIIKVYNYNQAGTRSLEKMIKIKRDASNPSKAEVQAQDITYDSFKLVCKAEDATSGIASYEIHVDNELKTTIKSTKNQVEYSITDQKTADHTAYIIVKDEAGNILQSASIQIHMGKVKIEEIDHVEFVITTFNITGEEKDQFLTEGVQAILSDTSISKSPKYIMMNTTNNVRGYVEGKIMLITTKGTKIDELEYFPKDLTINTTYYENGSGSTFEHERNATFFGTTLSGNSQPGQESDEISINVSPDAVIENKFSISDKKIAGTQTHIRVTIQSVKLSGNDIPFTLVQEK